MSEKNNEKPQYDLEGNIKDVLKGDALKNALDFAAFLRENGMVATQGEVSYKGQCVCYMHLDGAEQKPGPWTIWTNGDYSAACEDVPMDGRMKEIAWANMNFCASCGGGCSPGTTKTVFGKSFDNVCSSDMAFTNPDAEAVECVKRLLEMKKRDIEKSFL
jgi:hypothetical protein